MSISDEDMKKFVETVKEMHEMYTKALERENDALRNALADTQKKLDEALETIKNSSKETMAEMMKKWGTLNPPSTSPWIQPMIQPYVDPNTYTGPWTTSPYIPPATWGVSGGSTLPMNAIATGNTIPNDKLSDTIGKQYSNFISGSDDC